jgi:hypothetical protein
MDAIREEMAAQWEALFCHGIEHVMGDNQDLALGEVLGGVRPQLDALAHTAARLDELRGAPSNLVAKAVGGRVGQLIRALLRKSKDRATLHNEIDAVQALLEGAKLGDVVATGDWLAWAAEGLIDAERRPRDTDGAGATTSLTGYRRLRSGEQRIPLSCVLCEVALRIGRRTGAPEPARADLSRLLSSLPSELLSDLGKLDLARIERATDFLERWWTATAPRDEGASAAPTEVLEILWDEGALARFSLEAQLLADLIPAHQERAASVRKRLATLGESSRTSAVRLLREQTERRWSNVVGV